MGTAKCRPDCWTSCHAAPGVELADWLTARGEGFTSGVEIAALDPFHGYKQAINDELEDTTAVLDAFHAVKLALGAVDEVRRRLQQHINGHRGRKGDPLYGIRTIIRCAPDRLTERQWRRSNDALAADPRHEELFIAWQVAHELRQAYHHEDLPAGRSTAQKVLATLPSCPIPEIARLVCTLRRWKDAFLAYWTTDRSNNGGTEAINGLNELHWRLARGYLGPRQLPPANAPHRRRTTDMTPHSNAKSRLSVTSPWCLTGTTRRRRQLPSRDGPGDVRGRHRSHRDPRRCRSTMSASWVRSSAESLRIAVET